MKYYMYVIPANGYKVGDVAKMKPGTARALGSRVVECDGRVYYKDTNKSLYEVVGTQYTDDKYTKEYIDIPRYKYSMIERIKMLLGLKVSTTETISNPNYNPNYFQLPDYRDVDNLNIN